MALTFRRCVGAESGGGEQLSATAGSPAISTVTFRSGAYSYELVGDATKAQIRFDRADGSPFDNDLIIGFAIRFTDVTPSSTYAILAIVGATAAHMQLALNTSSNLELFDEGSTSRGSGSTTISINTWYKIEIRFRRGTTGTGEVDIYLAIDGNTPVSEIQDLSAGDYQNLSETSDEVLFQGPGSGDGTVFLDDIYIYDGGSTVGDFLGNFEVFMYNKTDGGATDQGAALDTGTWALASETPLDNTAGNNCAYTDDAGKSGGMRTDSGSNSGPSGDANITGTINGVEYVYNAVEGSGGGTPDVQIGNSSDGMTAQSFLMPTSFANFYIPSESATIMPETDEYFEIGMLNTGTADVVIGDAWAMLLHVSGGIIDLHGDVHGVDALSAALNASQGFRGASDGLGGVEGAMGAIFGLSGIIVADGDVEAVLNTLQGMFGDIAGSGEVQGFFGMDTGFHGSVDSISSLAAFLGILIDVHGEVITKLTVDAALARMAGLTGDIAGVAALAAALTTDVEVIVPLEIELEIDDRLVYSIQLSDFGTFTIEILDR